MRKWDGEFVRDQRMDSEDHASIASRRLVVHWLGQQRRRGARAAVRFPLLRSEPAWGTRVSVSVSWSVIFFVGLGGSDGCRGLHKRSARSRDAWCCRRPVIWFASVALASQSALWAPSSSVHFRASGVLVEFVFPTRGTLVFWLSHVFGLGDQPLNG